MPNILIETKGFESARLILKNMPGELHSANQRAITRALSSARSEAVKSSTDIYAVKAAELRSSIIMRPKAGEMISKGSPKPLMDFKVTPKRPGPGVVRASVKGAGGSIGYAFISQMANSHIGVFKRAGLNRYPIKQLYSVSAAQMIGEPTVVEQASIRAQEVYEERIIHEVDRVVNKY